MLVLGGLSLGVWIFVLSRNVKGMILLPLCVGAVICACSVSIGIFPLEVIPLQSLGHQDHLYRLFYTTQDTGSSTNISYIVIECDSWGVACRSHSWYRVDESPYQRQFSRHPADLFIDDSDHALKLRLKNEVYLIKDWMRN